MKKVAYDENEEPIILSKHLMDLLLAQDNAANLIALYCFYYYTAKWQKTNQVYSTTAYVAKGLNWSIDTVQKYKKQLLKLGLIDDVVERDSHSRIVGHYVRLSFIWTREKADILLNKVIGISTHTNFPGMESQDSNALNITNLNASNKINSSAIQRLIPDDKILPKQFDRFWNLYPNKDSKGAAFTAWDKLCGKKDRPNWKELRSAVIAQSKSDRWQDKQYIPMASTWLNQSRWLDDAELMIVYKRNNNTGKQEETKDPKKYGAGTAIPDHFRKQSVANLRKG